MHTERSKSQVTSPHHRGMDPISLIHLSSIFPVSQRFALYFVLLSLWHMVDIKSFQPWKYGILSPYENLYIHAEVSH